MLKLTYDSVRCQIENEGYKLLNTEYIGCNEKMKLQCNKDSELDKIKMFIGEKWKIEE